MCVSLYSIGLSSFFDVVRRENGSDITRTGDAYEMLPNSMSNT